MSETRRFPTHLEDFVLSEERRLQLEQEEPGSNVLTRKVTLRLGLTYHVALKLLARRYGVSVTAIGEKLCEMAAVDACDLAGITAEALHAEVEAELDFLNKSGEEHGGNLFKALRANDIELSPSSMDDRILIPMEAE